MTSLILFPPVLYLSFLYFPCGQTQLRSASNNSSPSVSFLVLFPQIPSSCLLLGLYALSRGCCNCQTHCEAANPVPELRWAESQGPGCSLLYFLLTCFHSMDQRVYFHCSSEGETQKHWCYVRHLTVCESFMCSQIAVKLQALKNNKSIGGFLCSQACFLKCCFDMFGSDSIFVCVTEHNLV